MKLKRLEIQGFKSFADKTEIVFEQGTTAIVGPNGSGKSNISDAVRWVLGEQSAKQLRGARMEDVIFGGTEKRKPLSWCEVSLLFDNEDRALAMDCAEVMVTRRVWRSGESEYYLNRAACRLKDITELFRDTGIGKEGYSLIGQGRIEEILSSKSDDRREVFEEAAGIVTYRVRKEEAERRMENTRQNLERVEDILGELQNQLEPLEKQAEDARKYLALRDSLRDLELNAFLLQHDRLHERIAVLEEAIAALDAQMAEAEPRVQALGEEREKLNARADALAQEDGERSAQVLEAARALEAREGANNVLRERIAHAQADARREDALAQEEEGRAGALEQLRRENEADIAARRSALEMERQGLSAMERALADAQTEETACEEALEGHKADIMRAMNRMADVKTARARLTGLAQSLTGRLEEAEAQAAALREGHEELEEAVGRAREALEETRAQMSDLEAEARALDEAVRAAGQESETLLARLRDRTGKRHETLSRLNMLREMERDYEGYQHAVRKALLYARGDKSVRGVVAGVLKTPREYERALEMVLGAALQQIITEDEQAAKRMIEYLRQNRLGRATFLPLTTVRGRLLSPQERQVLSMPGCVGVASELVRFEEEYRGVVESLLGRTVVAENLDAGIAIMRRGRHAFRLVTLGGDVMHPGGSMTGGSVQSSATSLLSREREIKEHQALLAALDRELADIQDGVAACDARRTEAKRVRNELFERVHQAEIAVARETEHYEHACAQRDAHDERSREAALLCEQIRTNMADIQEQLERAQADQAGGETSQEAMQQRTASLQAALAAAREKLETLREQVTAGRVSVATQERELDAARREGERLHREKGQLSQRREQRDTARRRQAESLAQDRQALEAGEQERAALSQALETRRAEQAERAEARRALAVQVREKTDALEALRQRLAADADRRHRQELQLVRAQGDLKGLQERIWSEYELTYAGAEAFRREDFDLREAEKQIASMRGQMRAMGSVNVNAVENYRLTRERFEQLNAQKQDLLKATEDLQGIIAELLAKMESRFRKQFALLNQYFARTFTALFGGGHAELKLADEHDVLGCAIDVVAQPPGKKLQLLSLLSGGERALTAIAILFAMLQLKPTPFCVLDEIEAALDEANVANFADYLNNFSARTQFVVVTHRRGTMERCQALYGVAMEEKGVSRMVSVRLADVGA